MYVIMRQLVLFLFCVLALSGKAQVFSCEQIQKDVDSWNQIKKSNNVKWAESIRDNELYKTDADGSLEYVYILTTTDSVEISKLRKIGFEFIQYYFNTSNSTVADMESNSPSDGVIFSGHISKVGEHSGLGTYNRINASVRFDIRFKPDRVRFSVKIQHYQVIKSTAQGVIQNDIVSLSNCFPINPNSEHKKSFAMAFINSNSKCLNYSKGFLNYLNKHIKEQQTSTVEDW